MNPKTAFLRLSIAHQASILLALMLTLATSVLYFWAITNSLQAEVVHARSEADTTAAFLRFTSKHSGVYIRRESASDVAQVGRYLASFTSDEQQADGTVKQYVFHQKNPFLALNDFSKEIAATSEGVRIKMASDNPMNPANLADLTELKALALMRSEGVVETWEVVGPNLKFARALVADQSCLKCHGDPDAAPPFVQTQYRPPMGGSKIGGGYGYVEGTVVAVTSVTVPHSSPLAMVASQGLGFWASAAAFVGLLVLAYWGVIAGISKPMRVLTQYATELANNTDVESIKTPVFDRRESTSQNETHKLSLQLKSLQETVGTAMARIRQLNRQKGQ